MPGRTLAVGDIHGCDAALDALLTHLQPGPDDTFVVLGDVVDRGPNTRRCIDRLLDLQRRTRLVFLLGNHEEMMLDAVDTGDWLDDWLASGGRETLQSYGGSFEQVPEEHFEFLRSGSDCHETATHLYVHAALEPRRPAREQESELLRWTRITGTEPPHISGKRVICGHTAQLSGVPLVWPGWACLDTACYAGGLLSALDVDANVLWQADPAGRLRGGVSLHALATP